MKKVIKISLAVVAALLIFLNVSLNLNGNKVEGINVTMKTKSAAAYWCWLDLNAKVWCYPTNSGYYCGESPTMDGCPNFE
jgi:hypothetical protein